ncbi:hypothetical protein R2F25_09880 [Streptomyces sp. UP1A-1]|nr:hypothetical protein [Streptomyces sp. UP1A-1]
MALGESTASIEAFRTYTAHAREPDDTEAVDRHLDALANLARLYAARERFPEARRAVAELREATERLRGPNAPDLADIDAFEKRLNRFAA